MQKQAVESWYRASTEQPEVAQEPPVSGLGAGREQKALKVGWPQARAVAGGGQPLPVFGLTDVASPTSYVTLARHCPALGLSFPSGKCPLPSSGWWEDELTPVTIFLAITGD